MTMQNYAHIAVVADRSGSMSTIEDAMNEALKSFLDTQATEAKGVLLVDITTFDTEIETPYNDAAVDDIKWPVINHRGSTALYDALGQTIVRLGEKFAKQPEDERPSRVVVVVVTDGHENASKEYRGREGAAKIKEMVERQQNEYQWLFVFLGANIDSFAVGGGLGFDPGSTLNYAATRGGVRASASALSDHVSSYLVGAKEDFSEEDRLQAMQQ